MILLISRTIAVILLATVCLTIEGCKRRTGTAETKGQNVQKSSQSTAQEDVDLQSTRSEILHEKETEPDRRGDKVMEVIVLLQERLSEEALLSFVHQISDNYHGYENRVIDVVNLSPLSIPQLEIS
jgi:hypothetical protein